jgi:hypothetical protein
MQVVAAGAVQEDYRIILLVYLFFLEIINFAVLGHAHSSMR